MRANGNYKIPEVMYVSVVPWRTTSNRLTSPAYIILCVIFFIFDVLTSDDGDFLIRNQQTHHSYIVIGMKVERIHINIKKQKKYSIYACGISYICPNRIGLFRHFREKW